MTKQTGVGRFRIDGFSGCGAADLEAVCAGCTGRRGIPCPPAPSSRWETALEGLFGPQIGDAKWEILVYPAGRKSKRC